MDITEDSAIVPSHEGSLFAKVTRVSLSQSDKKFVPKEVPKQIQESGPKQENPKPTIKVQESDRLIRFDEDDIASSNIQGDSYNNIYINILIKIFKIYLATKLLPEDDLLGFESVPVSTSKVSLFLFTIL